MVNDGFPLEVYFFCTKSAWDFLRIRNESSIALVVGWDRTIYNSIKKNLTLIKMLADNSHEHHLRCKKSVQYGSINIFATSKNDYLNLKI